MEAHTPYTNSSLWFHWQGNSLYYYDIVIARVEYVKSFFGKNYWNVEYHLPYNSELTATDRTSSLTLVKQHVQYAAQLMIDKIRSYDQQTFG